jgi:uncharacterized protein DUF2784
MTAKLIADFLLIVHFGFILFVTLGGLWVYRQRKIMFLHIPALAWGAWVELFSKPCPLTYWENSFRQQAGQAGYETGFIEHYLYPIIYPAGLTTDIQFILGCLLLGSNGIIYGLIVRNLFSEQKIKQQTQYKTDDDH